MNWNGLESNDSMTKCVKRLDQTVVALLKVETHHPWAAKAGGRGDASPLVEKSARDVPPKL